MSGLRGGGHRSSFIRRAVQRRRQLQVGTPGIWLAARMLRCKGLC